MFGSERLWIYSKTLSKLVYGIQLVHAKKAKKYDADLSTAVSEWVFRFPINIFNDIQQPF